MRPTTRIFSQYNGTAGPYSKVWISHAELVQGGHLVFELGPRPNPAYGSALKDQPDMIDFTGNQTRFTR